MYVDAQNLYSDAQAVTATANSTNVIDHGQVRDLGSGRDIYLVIGVDVAMTDAGSNSTVTVTLETDDNVGFTSATTAATLPVFAAEAAAGTQRFLKLPPGDVNERFSRLVYTVANGNLTTGSFTAFLTTDIDNYTAFADNYTITS